MFKNFQTYLNDAKSKIVSRLIALFATIGLVYQTTILLQSYLANTTIVKVDFTFIKEGPLPAISIGVQPFIPLDISKANNIPKVIKDVDQALGNIERSTPNDTLDDLFRLYQLYSFYHLDSIADNITIRQFNYDYSWKYKDLKLYVNIENYKNNHFIFGELNYNMNFDLNIFYPCLHCSLFIILIIIFRTHREHWTLLFKIFHLLQLIEQQFN